MKVMAVTMVKDEVDIIGATLRHMIEQTDGVIIADNGSTDGTYDVIMDVFAEYRGAGKDNGLLVDKEVAYYQSAKMTNLAEIATVDFDAAWVIPFDADEWWVSPWGTLAEYISADDERVRVHEAWLFDHVATGIDVYDPNPVRRLQWRRSERARLPKVAFRRREDEEFTIHQGNHGVTLPSDDETAWMTAAGFLRIHHFPYRSIDQMIRKVRNGARAYAATEGLREDDGAHWRKWGEFTDEQIADVFRTWYYREDPTLMANIEGEIQSPLVHNPVLP